MFCTIDLTENKNTPNGPHQGQPVLSAGVSLQNARAAMLMIHGRGADAQSILALVPEIDHPGFAYLAPDASGNTWYPYSFMAPLSQNEPYLSSALQKIHEVLNDLGESGFPPEKVMLLGFSQGACLALEYTARNARKYGGVIGLSGGLIGPAGTPRAYAGSLHGTPVFLGCSDADPFIAKERVQETTQVLRQLGGEVAERLYENMGHTVSQDEIRFIREMMRKLLND